MPKYLLLKVGTNAQPSGILDEIDATSGGTDTIRSTARFVGDLTTSKSLGINANPVTASGYVALSTITPGDSTTINNQALTAMPNPSGITNQFGWDGNDLHAASGLTTLINNTGLTALSGVVYAVQDGVNVNVLSSVPGAIGNAVTLAISSGGTVSGARLTGGAEGTRLDISFGI